MSSKNNPLNRTRDLRKKTIGGKEVRPALYVDPDNNLKYMAAAYEDGKLAIDPRTKLPIAYANAG